MPQQLLTLSVASPGFFGLNKQLSGAVLPPGWSSEATNVIFDESGRVASRKGYKNRFTSNPTGTPRAIHEYIDASGNKLVIFATNNAIYKDNGDGTFTDISGTITTPTADNWQFENFNSWCVGFQTGHAPIVITTTGGSFADSGGTQYNGDMVCAAGGRLWTAFGNTLYYSDLLINNFTGGSAGSFDLATYWPGGMDEAVAIKEFNGYLVVFGKDNIIIYDSAATTAAIVEAIEGIGCVARDSVQDIGTDILFLSRTGVRSLGRTIQEKSTPIRDVSKNVKDYVISLYLNESSPIKSVYTPEEGFYALSFPSSGATIVLDLKAALEDGSLRATEWDIAPTAFHSTIDSTMYMAFTTRVSEYSSYTDDAARDGTSGSSYQMLWEGAWNDFGEDARPFLKIPKKMSILMGGVSGATVSVKWAFDYADSFYKSDITFSEGDIAQYAVSKYTLAKYSGILIFNSAKTSMNATGQVIKFGIETYVDGRKMVLQRLDLAAKIGRQAL
jgi:hypothetical protein